MRTAVVDIGTNSARLLIADTNGMTFRVIKTGLITTRLGEGIGFQPELRREAMERTIDALIEFKHMIEADGTEVIIVAATSAVRDAVNSNEFLEAVRVKLGWVVRVLSGVEEAKMSYLGVIRGLEGSVSNPVVVDIGGGSTEFIWNGSQGINYTSIKAGAVRMTEKGSSLQDIRETLEGVFREVKNSSVESLIGVGGTLTTLAAIDQELELYDPGKVHGYYLSRERILAILDRLEEMTLEERRNLPGLQPHRADIIIAGVRIALAVVEGLGAQGITVSETDILYGLLYTSPEQKE